MARQCKAVNPPEPPSPLTSRRRAVLLPALLLPFLASFFYFVLFPGTTFGNSFYAGIKVFLLVWPFLATCLILKVNLIDRSREKRHLASMIPGISFGIVIVGVLVFLVKATPMGAVLDENSGRIAGRIHDLGVAEHFLWFALFISFAHAALEEFYWRWFVFGQAQRVMSLPVAYLVASLGFASHHIVVLSQFFPLGWAFLFGGCVAIGGAFWCWLSYRYNSLIGPWVSHMIIDLGLMWVGWEVLRQSSG